MTTKTQKTWTQLYAEGYDVTMAARLKCVSVHEAGAAFLAAAQELSQEK